jgi:hypothetical protein
VNSIDLTLWSDLFGLLNQFDEPLNHLIAIIMLLHFWSILLSQKIADDDAFTQRSPRSDLKDQLDVIEANTKDCRASIDTLNTTSDTATSENIKLGQNVHTIITEVAGLRIQNIQLQINLKTLTTELMEMKKWNEQLQQDFRILPSEIAEIKAQNKQLQRDVKTLRAKREENDVRPYTKLNEERKKVMSLERDVHSLKIDKQLLKQDLHNAEAENQELELNMRLAIMNQRARSNIAESNRVGIATRRMLARMDEPGVEEASALKQKVEPKTKSSKILATKSIEASSRPEPSGMRKGNATTKIVAQTARNNEDSNTRGQVEPVPNGDITPLTIETVSSSIPQPPNFEKHDELIAAVPEVLAPSNGSVVGSGNGVFNCAHVQLAPQGFKPPTGPFNFVPESSKGVVNLRPIPSGPQKPKLPTVTSKPLRNGKDQDDLKWSLRFTKELRQLEGLVFQEITTSRSEWIRQIEECVAKINGSLVSVIGMSAKLNRLVHRPMWKDVSKDEKKSIKKAVDDVLRDGALLGLIKNAVADELRRNIGIMGERLTYLIYPVSTVAGKASPAVNGNKKLCGGL